jgi:hypothetical protein
MDIQQIMQQAQAMQTKNCGRDCHGKRNTCDQRNLADFPGSGYYTDL